METCLSVLTLALSAGMFRDFIDETIFRLRLFHGASGLADDIAYYYRRVEVGIATYPEWFSYVVKYLACHAWHSREHNTVLAQIRRCAVAISELAGDAEQPAVTARLQSLFRLALGSTVKTSNAHELLWSAELASKKGPAPDLEDDILVAAAHLGYMPLVEKAVSEGRQCCPGGDLPEVSSRIFGNMYDAAVVGGDVSMMQLLLSTNADYKPGGPLPLKIRHYTLRYSSLCGNWDAYAFALGSEPLPIMGKTRDNFDYVKTLKSLDLYNRTVAALGDVPGASEVALLSQMATRGHTDMVKHLLLSQGPAELNDRRGKDGPFNSFKSTALQSAVVFGDLEVVKLILNRGADPNNYNITRTPLMTAARLGRPAIAEALIVAGAEVNFGAPPPIVMAVLKEDMDMFRLLRRRGATLETPETGAWAMAMARLHRLESMADVLEREGVERDATLYHCHRFGELYGYMFPIDDPDDEEDDD